MKRRNLLGVLVGTMLSLIVAFAGSYIAWRLLVGEGSASSNKDALISFILVQALAVNTIMAASVGLVVGWLVERRAWWLAGVSLLPLFFYGVVEARFERGESLMAISYVAVGLVSAFGVSRLKEKNPRTTPHVSR